MYSSEDLERFYFQYQTDALPHGISVQSFCLTSKVPYNLFSKWYKDTRKQIVEVEVSGRPPEADGCVVPEKSFSDKTQPSSSATRISVEVCIDNGLHLSQKDLSYQELVLLIEKLEGLC